MEVYYLDTFREMTNQKVNSKGEVSLHIPGYTFCFVHLFSYLIKSVKM